jgi:hypothetical protein
MDRSVYARACASWQRFAIARGPIDHWYVFQEGNGMRDANTVS